MQQHNIIYFDLTNTFFCKLTFTNKPILFTLFFLYKFKKISIWLMTKNTINMPSFNAKYGNKAVVKHILFDIYIYFNIQFIRFILLLIPRISIFHAKYGNKAVAKHIYFNIQFIRILLIPRIQVN